MYFANASAVLFKGNTRVDFGKNFLDKRPFFGDGKTWRGTIFSILTGTAVAFFIDFFFRQYTVLVSQNYLLVGFLLSAGAIFGDLAKSFLKRRMGLKQGAECFPLDQLDFVVGGLFFANFVIAIPLEEIVIILLLTIFVHRAANYLAYKLKLKNVPW